MTRLAALAAVALLAIEGRAVATISYVGGAINSKSVATGVADSIVINYVSLGGDCLIVGIGGANGTVTNFSSISVTDTLADTFTQVGFVPLGTYRSEEDSCNALYTNSQNVIALYSTSVTGGGITATVTANFTYTGTGNMTMWAGVVEYTGAAALGGVEYWPFPNNPMGWYGVGACAKYAFRIVDNNDFVVTVNAARSSATKVASDGTLRIQGASTADFATGSYLGFWDNTNATAGNDVNNTSTNNTGVTSGKGISFGLRSASTNNTFTFTQTATETATATNTHTRTHTATNTHTRTQTATDTRTDTVTFTNTHTATSTNTATSTATCTATSTSTATATATATHSATRTATSTSTSTATQTRTATVTSTATRTAYRTRTATATATGHCCTDTPVTSVTPSRTATRTKTRTWTRTKTRTKTPTRTPTP